MKGELGEIEIDGLKFGIYHGTAKEVKEQLINSGKYNILICGHTHIREPLHSDGEHENNGKTLVLNPGAAHKKVASISGAFKEGGIIIFDIRTRGYKFIDLP